jgi:predicted amino acid dehydrogenase
VAKIILIGRKAETLGHIQKLVAAQNAAEIQISTWMPDLHQAELVLTVTNAIEAVIEPHHLKSGAIVCDVARPRDVSRRVVEERDDVLVIEGGMVKVPGPVNFNFDFGFPAGLAFACMAETIVLALEGCYQSYTLGKHITLEQVETIATMAANHGFQVHGFRSFEVAVTDEKINQIKQNVRQKAFQLN